jgi:hypothetical protein
MGDRDKAETENVVVLRLTAAHYAMLVDLVSSARNIVSRPGVFNSGNAEPLLRLLLEQGGATGVKFS